ncbi:dihydroorotase [Prosthecochloris sp. N3]|uniref:Dihydroorotase n=1 Tax=Prosthecochloris ethylica TaxID=2743976 RepID=A0ABR9XQ50_9CHLB|nr:MULTISPECIES: dihydroorotase [Prosthecochloris]MBF0586214.1 dihydroorotase [Prosthecochloris ethylica]MBF0635920.1 dihydroorotase [Prosthecochloris ethylica]NUK47405.1 dihydroorotase [Prosthecochloris ethylica]RNA64955.1 dihydroorotase [Prosthecochloris sp. ZM_2]
MSIIFQRAHLLNPAENLDGEGSIKLSDSGVIEEIATGPADIAPHTGDRTIDMNGMLIVPGLFDMHCHFREPGQEYKETLETGSRAAVAGGFTGVALMPNTKPVTDNPQTVAYIREQARQLPVDMEVIAAMTVGSGGETLAPFGRLSKCGVRAVSDDGTAIQNSNIMRLAFEYASNFDMLFIQHCEDISLTRGGIMNEGRYSAMLGLKGIPDVAEAITLGRDMMLLDYLGRHKFGPDLPAPRYHVAHISTKGALDQVRQARAQGIRVTCEVTPHHFTLTEEDLFKADQKGNFIMKPPLCSRENHEALIEAIIDGTIDAIATDHAPHALHEKECPPDQAAFGITGLETALGLTISELVETGRISMARAIELLSINPRSIMGLESIRFETGNAANFTFIDPRESWTYSADRIRSKASNSPFIGRTMTGRAIGICHKGQLHGLEEQPDTH